MSTPAIEVRNLTKQFRVREGWFRSRRVAALEDVSFAVGPGEACGLLGPNGSGKSTLLRILSTVLLPTSGEAWIGGISVSLADRIKALMGVVPSEPRGFSRELTGKQNLSFFATLQRLEPERIPHRTEHLLRRVGIAGLGEQPFWTYSTGQRQRLNIARALLHEPPILLFDEPTKGLDPWTAGEIRLWIREELVRRQEKTLLVASNQMEDVETMCDRVVLLRKGRLTFVGRAEEAEGLPVGRLA